MALAVSCHGVKKLVEDINEMYGKHIVTAELQKDGWVILVGEEIRIMSRHCEAIQFLDGLNCMTKIKKDKL